ncbi:MAG: zinc-binding alcohol dehydrogenase [Gemmatimonadetes bacterium]|nr:zinc-binding alcohol dehydrogenase [Gemmatimonadota bacterium]MDA1103965.1 zinc-binding alcohol dehydrogenase [Gemmatimonadota bacterium]
MREPGLGEIVSRELGPRQGHEVLVRAHYSGISRGTESLVFRGEVPVSQYATMRAPFQEGDFPGPVKYGYASVGEVLQGPAGLQGRTVFCLHPHQDLYHVPAAAVVPLPDGVPPARAVLAANVETALNAVWDAEPVSAEQVVVIGAGVVGLLTAWLLQEQTNMAVTAFDVDSRRAPVAEALGVPFTTDSPEGRYAGLVVHASGSEQGLRTALATAGIEATILELSWYGDRNVSLPLGEAFHSRRLTLRSSQVGRIPPHRAESWDHRRRLEAAVRLLEDDRLDALISGESAFDELPETMRRLSQEASGALCHRIRYLNELP